MLIKLTKYGPLNNVDIWKFFAIITMLIDHIGFFFFPENDYFRAIGRASAPIWLYFVGLHFNKGNDIKLASFCLAMVAAISFAKGSPDFNNILISIILYKLLLRIFDKNNILEKIHYGAILWLCICLTLITVSMMQYGSVGFMFALCGFMKAKQFSNEKIRISFIITCIFYIALSIATFELNIAQSLITVTLVSFALLKLYHYEFKTFGFKSAPIMFLSRYSMEVYFAHYLLFTIIQNHFL